MNGLDEFLQVFGDVTVADIVKWIFIFIFLFKICKELKRNVDNKIEEHNQKEKQEKEDRRKLEVSYNATQKYPEYRKQSIEMQKKLEAEIQVLKDGQAMLMKRFEEIAEQNKKRDCNKLRDMLLQSYRYYTNKTQNPSQSWTRMEAEAFWDLFRDYEDLGGDGYMHTEVQPAMERLLVIEIGSC